MSKAAVSRPGLWSGAISAITLLLLCTPQSLCAQQESSRVEAKRRNAAAEPLRIETDDSGLRVVVIATLDADTAKDLAKGGLSRREGLKYLRFALHTERGVAATALFGDYQFQDGVLTFTPRYSLAPGNDYVAELTIATKAIRRDYHAPPLKPTPPTVVDRVYPTSPIVPANLLKFYVHFSQPMREGPEIFQHFHLYDASGEAIIDPWRHTELWSADARRLTLWIHPGRIKRGVNLREDFGPVLRPNEKYRLVVDRKLRDAFGKPLARSYEKKFSTIESDTQRPLPRSWRVSAPRADSRDPLKVVLSEPLDRALLLRFLLVIDAKGERVPGKISLAEAESVWVFTPTQPWRAASYRLRANPELEDLAGNTPARIFDDDLAIPTDQLSEADLSIRFEPRSSSDSP